MKNGILILLFIIFWSCNNERKSTNFQDESNKIDTISFEYEGFNSGIILNLFSNGKFYYENYGYGCTGGGENEKVYGEYTMNNQKLILHPDSINIGIIPFTRHNNPIIQNLKYGADSLKVKTKYDILKWNNTYYLLSEERDSLFRNWYPMIIYDDIEYINEIKKWNDYYEFADFYNSGLEPRSHGKYLTRTDSNINDTLTTELDMKNINEKWRYLFLEKPITGRVIKLKKNKKRDPNVVDNYLVEIDKGSLDGVNIGVVIFKRKDFDDYIKIIKVFPNKSIGFFYQDDNVKKLKVGDTVKSSWR